MALKAPYKREDVSGDNIRVDDITIDTDTHEVMRVVEESRTPAAVAFLYGAVGQPNMVGHEDYRPLGGYEALPDEARRIQLMGSVGQPNMVGYEDCRELGGSEELSEDSQE